jgi:hypothetical protein
MNTAYAKAGATTGAAYIEKADVGGFTAIASNTDLDRDGERMGRHCFDPLPSSVPVHLGHTMQAADVVARARPYYQGDQLMIDARFTSTADSQEVRTKILDGTLNSLSIVFKATRWENVEGVRTCVLGELLAVDIVSVPSLPSARILSMRSMGAMSTEVARDVAADALLTLARAEVAHCKAKGYVTSAKGLHRRRADDLLREALNPDARPTNEIRRFLRSL